MAINRKDYNYVKNTIPTGAIKPSDGSLQIGSRIVNCVVDLNEDTVFNVNFPEYYQDKHSLTQGWSSPGDAEETYEQTLSQTFSEADFLEKEEVILKSETIKAKGKVTSVGLTGVYANEFKVDLVYYLDFLNLWGKEERFWEIEGFKVNPPVVTETMNWNTGELEISILYSSPLSEITIIIPMEYGIQVEVKKSILDWGFNISSSGTIQDITISGNDVYASSWDSSHIYATLRGKKEQTEFSATALLEYKDIDYTSSIEEGALIHQVTLEKDTSYVLQVIDAIQPYNINNLTNKIESDTSQSWSFGQYLFFKTSDNAEAYYITLQGVSFGYKILGQINGNIVDLRSFYATKQAKVFLFKSDLPWIVNKEGVVVGLKDTPLMEWKHSSNSPKNPLLTTNDVVKMFSCKPEILFTNSEGSSTIKVMLPDAVDGKNWKHYPLWSLTEASQSCPEIIKNLKLLVYRDFLTEAKRYYNEQYVTKRRGLVRILSRTSVSPNDTYSNVDLNNDEKFDGEDIITIGFKQPKVSITENMSSVNFTLTTNNKETYTLYNTESEIPATYEITLPLISLLGYNWTHSSNRDIIGEEGSLGYKYTSVCFAWGWGNDRDPTRISEFSDPIIIDRSIVQVTKNANGTIEVTPQNCETQKNIILEYYDTPVIQINKK